MSPAPTEQPILAAWARTLAQRGTQVAIQGVDGSPLRTFAEIEGEAAETERMLAAFPAGSVVAVQMGNSPSWPAALLALWRRQLVPLPLGSHVEPGEMRAIVETCGIAAILTVQARGLASRAVGTGEKLPTWPEGAPDFLKLTSGTSQAPRAIRFTAAQLLADGENICATMGITDRDLNFGAIPFSHSYGFSNLLTPLLCHGVPLVATEERLPRALLEGLRRSGATVFPGMPIFYEKLAGLRERGAELNSLRLCISAGAPLGVEVAEAFRRSFGLKVHSFYGSSECGGISYDRSEAPVRTEGFVGTPMEGVRIDRLENQRIAVRSGAVGIGYYPEADRETLGENCFHPGDLIEWTEDGMFIAGRATDVINIAGRKLNPAELEARIASFPGVKRAIVFGVPSALRGEEPVCCVEGEGIDRAALHSHCAKTFSTWQMPRDFWIVPEISANERGKISRRTLAELYLTMIKKRA